jgi:hypothetical protein
MATQTDRREPVMNAWRIAELWTELMSVLGHERFGAQGRDTGAGVGAIPGLRHPERTVRVHLNYIPRSYCPCGGSSVERGRGAFIRDRDVWAEGRERTLTFRGRGPAVPYVVRG